MDHPDTQVFRFSDSSVEIRRFSPTEWGSFSEKGGWCNGKVSVLQETFLYLNERKLI